jgi:hypothetical protein
MNYIEYLNIPTKIAVIFVIVLLVAQLVGALLSIKGFVVPEFMNIKKYFKKKKEERKAMVETLNNVKILLNEVNEHYSEDNITKRDSWMNWVNERAKVYDAGIVNLEEQMLQLQEKVAQNNEIALSLAIDTKRNFIIDFASKVVDENYPVTREQFNRVIKVYKEYEEIIEDNELENGEVDIAIRIIEESYEKHMKNHSFIENIRGYDLS